jgi:hypothetical protein
MDLEAATDTLINGLKKTEANADFLAMAKETFRNG